MEQINQFSPFRLNLRFHLFENISVQEVKRLMLKCANDSYGIILKAENSPVLVQTIAELQKYRLPVVTIVTDIPASKRLRYVGMDNQSAGKTAAYLMSRWLRDEKRDIAVVLGSKHFLGEEERVQGFCDGLREMAPQLNPVRISDGYGIDAPTFLAVKYALQNNPALGAVYCVGGGNAAIRRAFTAAARDIKVFIGHDLDDENCRLIRHGQLDAVIQHDLQEDARSIFRTLLTFHGFIPASDKPEVFSKVSVITPYNL
ncbi:substrate-binding domain-containing protein [Erwinia sp. V71]|uniref:substrate-binding domain-containing protein n=1 Tax=Erwinia sp. V71 TaxID=3369424 RepID=UPI003F5D9B86